MIICLEKSISKYSYICEALKSCQDLNKLFTIYKIILFASGDLRFDICSYLIWLISLCYIQHDNKSAYCKLDYFSAITNGNKQYPNLSLTLIPTSTLLVWLLAKLSSPTDCQNADKFFFLNESRLKGPKSSALALMTSNT